MNGDDDKRNRVIDGRTFAQWKYDVNVRVQRIAGLSCDDLPDCDYWCWWNDGVTPADAARDVLDDAGFPMGDDDE